MKKYDAIIIGSGQGGTPLARKLAAAGYKTALIERRWVGGTCINDGCTPTKAMIASAEVAYRMRNTDALGVKVKDTVVDIETIIARQQSIVTSFRNSSEGRLIKTENLDLLYGEASFAGLKQLFVQKRQGGGSEEVSSDLIFIDAGTSPAIPDIKGIETVPYLTSTSILTLKELPEHLLIIGGGYVAMEFAQMYRRFGSQVTMVVRGERVLRNEDEDIISEIHELFSKENIDIRLHAQALTLKGEAGDLKALIKVKDGNETISCSHVLVATGRKAETATLNLPATGVRTNEKGFISVDNKLQTNVKGIFAMGDINGGPAFTHISYHDHLILFNNLIHHKDQTTDGRMLPYCVYIDPQLGRVGLTEQEARSKGMNIQIAKLPMTSVARAIETEDTRGVMKAIVNKEDKKILGASVLGAQGGEIISVIEVAMMGGLTYDQLRDGIFAHPTYAESLNNLFATIDQ